MINEIVQRGHTCIDGSDPDDPAPVPGSERFTETGVAFIGSAQLSNTAELLRRRYEMRFESWNGLTVDFLWKAKGGGSPGTRTFGTCVRASGLVKHYSQADFIIWLAADHCRTGNGGAPLTRFQVEALLFHEMLHVMRDENGKPMLRPHDLEVFAAEIAEYGAWRDGIWHIGNVVLSRSDDFTEADALIDLPMVQG